MSTSESPVLVSAHQTWPTLAGHSGTSDATRLRKLAYARVSRAPDAEEQELVPGAFVVLPVELVDLICVKLLRIGFAHFFSFVRTCRAAYHVVSKRTRIEVMCMKNLFSRPSLAAKVARADEAEQYPFTELAKTMIRSRIEQEVLMECAEESVLHCANPTSECCRTKRAELNVRWRQYPTIAERFPKGTLGAEALRGRQACHAHVAASADAQLLCATPDGAVLASADRVWKVTSKPAAEFTPGCELATTFLMERSDPEPMWAAAEGNRIALCQRTHSTEAASFYVVKVFDDGRLVDEAEVSDPCMFKMSRRNRWAPSFMEKMWIHKGKVWFVFLHEQVSNETFSWVQIMAIQPDVGGNRSTCERDAFNLVHSFGRVDCTHVASDSGDLVLLETLPRETRVWHFDMQALTFALVPLHPLPIRGLRPILEATLDKCHQARLSPDGLRLALLDRKGTDWQHGDAGPIRIYSRSSVDGTQQMQWRLMWTGGGSPHRPVSTVVRSSPLIEAVFTPCGRRFYAFFLATEYSPGGMLRLDTTFTNEVNDTFYNIPPYRLPTKAVWSKDGLFVHTATKPGGVLRLGLVE